MTAPLALTMGEPAGIGGEIALKAWHAMRRAGAPFFAVGDVAHHEAIARTLGIPVAAIDQPEEAAGRFRDAFPVLA
ncbi:MAG: 4-hydroxythreonine-4-phosphate dehydrogenase, partial [Alphaproteobacteria bacterium]|nr:4-hydroxythreonine-4-phosphate dehydrogenase [Alphaproteobacteria bacterium]